MIPVLEVGGTHVSSAIVDTATWELIGASTRLAVGAGDDASSIVATFVRAADAAGAQPRTRWGVAMPDPFDYATEDAPRAIRAFKSGEAVDFTGKWAVP